MKKSLISRAFRVVSPHVKAAMTNEEEADNVNQISKQSSQYIVSIHQNTLNNRVILNYHWTTKQPELDLPEGFLSVLPDMDGDHQQETLNDAVRDVHNNLVWNAKLVPARTLGFVQDCDDEVCVIIHSCYKNSKTESVLTRRWLLEFEEDDNTFDASLQPGKDRDDMSDKTPLIRCVLNVDCIERHCLMIPYHDKSHFLIELLPQEQWSDKFVVW